MPGVKPCATGRRVGRAGGHAAVSGGGAESALGWGGWLRGRGGRPAREPGGVVRQAAGFGRGVSGAVGAFGTGSAGSPAGKGFVRTSERGGFRRRPQGGLGRCRPIRVGAVRVAFGKKGDFASRFAALWGWPSGKAGQRHPQWPRRDGGAGSSARAPGALSRFRAFAAPGVAARCGAGRDAVGRAQARQRKGEGCGTRNISIST